MNLLLRGTLVFAFCARFSQSVAPTESYQDSPLIPLNSAVHSTPKELPTAKVESSTGSTGATGMTGSTGLTGGPGHSCVEALSSKISITKTPEEKWPKMIQDLCLNTLSPAKDIDPDVILKTCKRGFDLVQRMHIGTRSANSASIAQELCGELKAFFVHSIFSKTDGSIMAFGTASDGPESCCSEHTRPGCVDNSPLKNIQDCVCKGIGSKGGKSDNHCCTDHWDRTCVENVAYFSCASCPKL